MRKYIRHPSDIPIHYEVSEEGPREVAPLRNVDHGGLCFRAENPIKPGSSIRICFPIRDPDIQATGTVVWCRRVSDQFDVGVRFDDEAAEFAVRMVEQVCYIEHYRKEVLAREGRRISGEQAALEWTARFAEQFPR
ncbi:MAG: PilZ domain-containing protein [Chromatiales bacterium]|jgi:hypothetical protein